MISRNIFTDIIYILLFVAFQIFVINEIGIYQQKYTAVFYPAFVMFFPFFRSKYVYFSLSFLIGLLIDSFLGTWGINASATLSLAYFRAMIFRNSAESTTDFFSFQDLSWVQFSVFILFNIFLHQLIVQYLEFFKTTQFFEIFFNVLVTSVISFLFILLYAMIFKVKEKV